MDVQSAASRLAAAGVAYAPQIARAALEHHLDPTLLAAVAAQETGGPGSNAGRNVVGDGGHGHGLFQIDDRWHGFARTPAAMEPAANADYAAGMLSGLLAKFGGSVRAALSAYNAGSPTATGTTTRWGDGRELGYADSVMRHYGRLADAGAPAAAGEPASPAESAVNELGTLLGSMNALPSLAAGLPSPFSSQSSQSQPSQPQRYQPQATDYGQLFDDGGDSG